MKNVKQLEAIPQTINDRVGAARKSNQKEHSKSEYSKIKNSSPDIDGPKKEESLYEVQEEKVQKSFVRPLGNKEISQPKNIQPNVKEYGDKNTKISSTERIDSSNENHQSLHEVQEETVQKRYVRPLQEKGSTQPKYSQQLKVKPPKQRSAQDILKASVQIRNKSRLVARQKGINDHVSIEEESIEKHRPESKSTSSKETLSNSGAIEYDGKRIRDSPTDEVGPTKNTWKEKIRRRYVRSNFRNLDLTNSPEQNNSAVKVFVPQSKIEKFDFSPHVSRNLDGNKRHVNNSSSMPLKILENSATDPRSITKISLCLQTSYTTKLDEVLEKSLEYIIDHLPYPIGDSGILNTYKKEIIYTLDKIIEEIQHLMLKKCKCKTKKVCFAENEKANIINTNNRPHSSSSKETNYFQGCSYDNIFQTIDSNNYIQLLLRSIIVQIGFDDILEMEIHNQYLH